VKALPRSATASETAGNQITGPYSSQRIACFSAILFLCLQFEDLDLH
jgi:hypothetical protein